MAYNELENIVVVRKFRSGSVMGVGELHRGDHVEFFVTDAEHDSQPQHTHCGPYSTRAQAEQWIHDIREDRL